MFPVGLPDSPEAPGGASCSGGARCFPLSTLSSANAGPEKEGRASSSRSSSSSMERPGLEQEAPMIRVPYQLE